VLEYRKPEKVSKILVTQAVEKLHTIVYSMSLYYIGHYVGYDIKNYRSRAELEENLKKIYGDSIDIEYTFE